MDFGSTAGLKVLASLPCEFSYQRDALALKGLCLLSPPFSSLSLRAQPHLRACCRTMAALKLSVMSVLVLHLTVLTFATRPAEDLAASSLDVRAQLAMRSLHLPQMPQSILDDGSRSNASNASSASGANNSSPSGSLKARGPGPSSLAQASSSAGTEYELHLERRSFLSLKCVAQ